jgi:hypothetical protein
MKGKFVLLLLTMITPLLLANCGNDTGILSEKVAQGISKLKTPIDYSKNRKLVVASK